MKTLFCLSPPHEGLDQKTAFLTRLQLKKMQVDPAKTSGVK